MLRLGRHLVAAGHFADGDAVAGLIEFRHQLVEQLLYALRGLLQGHGDLRQGERFLGHVDDGFQNGFDLRVFLRNGGGRVVERQQARGHHLLHRRTGLRACPLRLGDLVLYRRRRFKFRACALRGCFQFFHARYQM